MRPGCVVAAFDVPLGHLVLDDARCCARTADGVESPEEAVEEDEPAGTVTSVLARGEKRPGGRSFAG